MDPTLRHVPTLLLALAATPLAAQHPAPAGELAPRALAGAWTPDEAMAWSCLHDWSEILRRVGPSAMSFDREFVNQMTLCGLGLRRFDFTNNAWTEGQQPKAPAWALYLWPTRANPTPGFAFCLVSDGGLLVSPNSLGYCGQAPAPEAEAATGGGSKGRFADLLLMPGKGTDGQIWETRDTLRPSTITVALRDQNGEPVPAGQVLLVPQSWLGTEGPVRKGCRPLERAVPAGRAFLDRLGNGRIEGMLAKELFVCAGDQGFVMPLLPEEVRWEGDRLVLRVDREAQRVAASLARANANESAAIATLKNISSAQAQCQASSAIDANSNGAGEYGCFAELAGAVGVRAAGGAATGNRIAPPVLSTAFAKVSGGVVQRSGYCFRMFLPGKDGTAVTEDPNGKGMAGIAVDPKLAEVQWCCYAWPVTAGESGKRAFFVDQSGDVFACTNDAGRYSGSAKAPEPSAARGADTKGTMADPAAANAAGRDGQRWTVVN